MGKFSKLLRSSLLHQIHKTYNQRQPLFKSFYQEINHMKTNLLNYDLNGLTHHFAEMGEKPFRAKQVMRWIHQAGAQSFDEMTDLAKSLRLKLNEQASVDVPKLMMAQESSDGTLFYFLKSEISWSRH